MDIFMLIFAIIVGTVIFVILNRVMDISYFGFAARASLWLACAIVGTIACVLLAGFAIKYYKLILGIVVVIGILAYFGKKSSDSNQENEEK